MKSYKSKLGSPLLARLLNIFQLWSSTIDPSDLFDLSPSSGGSSKSAATQPRIVDILKSILLDIAKQTSKQQAHPGAPTSETLLDTLRVLDNLIKYVSEFVKEALQAKKSAAVGKNDAELAQKAERLLQLNKPIVECCPLLVSLLVSDDADVADAACRILWILIQLFGSECKDLLNAENLNTLM